MKITQELYDTLKELRYSMIGEDGKEYPNPVPTHINTGLERPLTLQEQIQRVLRTELSKQAQQQGLETFDESEDFEITDDFDGDLPNTRYMVQEFPSERGGTGYRKEQKIESLDSSPANSPKSGSLTAEPAPSDPQPAPAGE